MALVQAGAVALADDKGKDRKLQVANAARARTLREHEPFSWPLERNRRKDDKPSDETFETTRYPGGEEADASARPLGLAVKPTESEA